MVEFERTEVYILLKDINSETRFECLKLLKKGGCDLTVRDQLGNGYFHLICSHPDIKQWDLGWYLPIFYQLGLHGMDVNAQNNEGNTVLHFAVTNQLPLRALNVLMKLGGDATLSNNNGLSPVHLAEDTKFANMVDIMYEGLSPALQSENEEAVEFLLNSWCYPNSVTLNGVFQDQDVMKWKIMEKNHFVHATLSGDVEEMKALYSDVIDLTYRDLSNLNGDGELTPLPLICDVYDLGLLEPLKFMTKKQKCSTVMMHKEGLLDVPFWLYALRTFTTSQAQLILPLLRDVELKPSYVDVDLMTSLYLRSAPTEVIWKLITLGFALWQRDHEGRTFRDRVFIHSLSLEATKRKENLLYVDQHVINLATDTRLMELRQLLEYGYDHIMVETLQGRSVLSVAKKQKLNDDVVHFLERICDWQVNVRAVQKAIVYGNLPIVRDHISSEIAHCRDEYGRTFLHLSALYDRVFIMKLLLRDDLCKGIIDVPDQHGRTPLIYARSVPNSSDVEKLLLDAGAKKSTKDAEPGAPMPTTEPSLVAERSLPDLDLDLYLLDRYLMLEEAIGKGMRDRVCKLCENMYKDCDLNMFDGIRREWKDAINYKHLLEICVLEEREEIAMYLLRMGILFEHVKSLDQLEPGQMISLGEAAQQRDMYNLVRQIKKQKAARRFEAKVNALATETSASQRRNSDPDLSKTAPSAAVRESSDPCLRKPTDNGDSGVVVDSTPIVENTSTPKKSKTCTVS